MCVCLSALTLSGNSIFDENTLSRDLQNCLVPTSDLPASLAIGLKLDTSRREISLQGLLGK